VIGINSAISARASSIGFAVPINQAAEILDQLKTRGRVSRGFIGVELTDVTPSLQQSLHLTVSDGALVQDVKASSPAERAGLQPYDVIVDVEGQKILDNEELIRHISSRQPGTLTRLGIIRDGRPQTLQVKLAERPQRSDEQGDGLNDGLGTRRRPPHPDPADGTPLGVTVRELDRNFIGRLEIPATVQGVVIARVDPTGAGFQSQLRRGLIIMEINRRPVRSVADYQRIVSAVRPGDVLALYVYDPTIAQRSLVTVTAE
jgi:serine protease Do